MPICKNVYDVFQYLENETQGLEYKLQDMPRETMEDILKEFMRQDFLEYENQQISELESRVWHLENDESDEIRDLEEELGDVEDERDELKEKFNDAEECINEFMEDNRNRLNRRFRNSILDVLKTAGFSLSKRALKGKK